ncbi:MAG TPA: hypothetical protein VMW38_12285 [Terriglobia bacterium]|nr:hypothetical protein [Terriglobia bacterium]
MRKPSWKYLLLLFLFMAAIFWKLFLTPEYSMMTYPDNASQSYPWSQYIAYALHHGSFPFWDIFSDGGRSFIGEGQTGVFYLPNLIMGSAPLSSKGLLSVLLIEGFVVLHCFLASYLMYRLALYLNLAPFYALVSGLTFAYCGSVGARAFAQINIFYGAVWVPAVFLFFLMALHNPSPCGRMIRANLAGLFLALSFLAGHHQPFFYTGIAIAMTTGALWFIQGRPTRGVDVPSIPRRHILWVAVLISFFTFCYVSLQLFPSLEYSRYAYRWLSEGPLLASKRIPYSLVGTKHSLGPGGLMATFFPYLYGSENSPYFGILPLLFAIISLKEIKKSVVVRWAWILTALFFLISLGQWSPLHGLFYILIPGFDKGRQAARALLVPHLAISFLAGYGAQICFRPLRKQERWWALRWHQILLWLSAILSLIIFACYIYELTILHKSPDFDLLFFELLLILSSSLFFVCRYYAALSPTSLKVAVVIILLFDFNAFLSPHMRLKRNYDNKKNCEPTQYYRQDELIKFLQARPAPFRVDVRDDLYPDNGGQVYRLETINSYSATRLALFQDYLYSDYSPGNCVSSLLNVKYVVSGKKLPMVSIFESKGIQVYENPNCLPRAWLVRDVCLQPSDAELMAQIQAGSFRPLQRAVIEGTIPAGQKTAEPPGIAGTQPSAEIIQYRRLSPNRFVIEVQAPLSAYLIVSEMWFPGWLATVQGQLRTVYRTDGFLMGVWVEAGRSRVEFCYRPTHLAWGLVLTSLGLVCLLVAALTSRGVSSNVHVHPA